MQPVRLGGPTNRPRWQQLQQQSSGVGKNHFEKMDKAEKLCESFLFFFLFFFCCFGLRRTVAVGWLVGWAPQFSQKLSLFCFRFVTNRRSWIAIPYIAYTKHKREWYQFIEWIRNINWQIRIYVQQKAIGSCQDDTNRVKSRNLRVQCELFLSMTNWWLKQTNELRFKWRVAANKN